ncbi:MAG: hypothetical protein KAH84_11875 [Thiomargarita sp.]|nr:hypothetical protein [Thiomargarita sp.]
MSLTRRDVHIEMSLADHSSLTGTLVIDRESRLSDVLNKGDKDFFVLQDYKGNHHIINKQHIVKIVEIESLDLE